jgi:hypothetical protein
LEDFLSAPDSAPEETELLFEPLAAESMGWPNQWANNVLITKQTNILEENGRIYKTSGIRRRWVGWSSVVYASQDSEGHAAMLVEMGAPPRGSFPV